MNAKPMWGYMKTSSLLAIALVAGVAASAGVSAAETHAGRYGSGTALDAQDLPTFYIETASRSSVGDSSLDTLAFYTPMVARAETGADVEVNEAFYLPMVAAQPSLDLLVFYTPMVARPITTFDSATDTLAFYTPMVITRDLQASIDTLAFYTAMVERPAVVEFDIQTSFDVPVPYEYRAAREAAEST